MVETLNFVDNRHGRRRKRHRRRRGAIFWSAAAAFDRRGKILPEPMLNLLVKILNLGTRSVSETYPLKIGTEQNICFVS